MTSKHTPGPWRVDEYTSGNQHFGFTPACAVMCRDNNKVICEIPDYTTGQHDVEDARLIAAAPDLLDALVEAIACGMVPISSAKEGGASAHSRQVRCADMIRVAIAKATGESV